MADSDAEDGSKASAEALRARAIPEVDESAALEMVNEARREVERDLSVITSDAFDAPYRDSILLVAHILETHKVRRAPSAPLLDTSRSP